MGIGFHHLLWNSVVYSWFIWFNINVIHVSIDQQCSSDDLLYHVTPPPAIEGPPVLKGPLQIEGPFGVKILGKRPIGVGQF